MNCTLCNQHFPIRGLPCTEAMLLLPNQKTQVAYGRILWTGRRPYPQCATSSGQPHHMPCDREYCPACCDGQTLTSCLQRGGEPLVVVLEAALRLLKS
jgi:hypothetical protein